MTAGLLQVLAVPLYAVFFVVAITWAVPALERRTAGTKVGLVFRWGSLWVGAHWSPYNRRLCVNLLPCCTLWLTLPGGNRP